MWAASLHGYPWRFSTAPATSCALETGRSLTGCDATEAGWEGHVGGRRAINVTARLLR